MRVNLESRLIRAYISIRSLLVQNILTMKIKKLSPGLLGLVFTIALSCQTNDEFTERKSNPENARLKRVLLYSSVNSEKPVNVVEEYEYDELNRISRVSTPTLEDGLMKYDAYEYNANGQLVKIMNYNANINSSTGFINLKNHTFSYDAAGKKEKESVEYPQTSVYEYALFIYDHEKLVKTEKYNSKDELESYVSFEYNDDGMLVKETAYTSDHKPYSITTYAYTNGLNTKTDIYAGKDMEQVREIIKKYDERDNLIVLESNELTAYSALMDHVLKYEYYED